MRWNCPHCEELVTAGIDFENTKKAYVRCSQCNGTALIHRSAVLADYAKSRRTEEEAQLEAELRLTQTATANARLQTLEVQIRGLNERLANERLLNERKSGERAVTAGQPGEVSMGMPPLPNSAMLSAGMEIGVDGHARSVSPPPFAPAFTYANPPAFLMKATAIETIERSFALDSTASFANELSIDGDLEAAAPSLETRPLSSIRPMLALWAAAALAIASGYYLYQEGKKALTPVNAPVHADEIRSKANSAVRPETRSLVIVSVARAVLRNAPSVEAVSIQTLDRSAIATLVEEKDGWVKIASPSISTSDRTAWIRGDLVRRMPD